MNKIYKIIGVKMLTYSTQLSHLDIDFDMDYIKNIPMTAALASNNPEHLKRAYDLGYRPEHITTAFSDFITYDNHPEFLNPVFEHFPNPEYIRARFRMNRPGTMFKKHKDFITHTAYESFWKDQGVSLNMGENYNNFRRAIVFCEDWKDGHISIVEETMFYDWKAGDYVFWSIDHHAAANIGKEDRYVLAVDHVV